MDLTVFNVIVYSTLGLFLVFGLYASRKSSEATFLSDKNSQRCMSLATNFFATSLGSWILFSLPQVGTIAGIIGVVAYALATILPLVVFSFIGPFVKSRSPDGFTLTQFISDRFGSAFQVYVSVISVLYMILFMSSELTGLAAIIQLLAGIDSTLPIIVLLLVTCIYTTIGGFKASMLTDKIQGYIIFALVLSCSIGVATFVRVDAFIIELSDLLKPNRIGFEMLYVLPVAVVASNLFHQGFWQRVYAAENINQLCLGSLIGSLMILPVVLFLGLSGMLSVWTNSLKDQPNYVAFFALLNSVADPWLVGIVLVLAICLAASAVDTCQSALTATIVNDMFKNKMPITVVRVIAFAVNIPALFIAISKYDVLQLFLIADMFAVSVVVPILLGMMNQFNFVRGVHAFIGGIFGLLGVVIYGWKVSGSIMHGIRLLSLPNGFYEEGTVFYVFVIVPVISAIATLLSGLISEFFKRTSHIER